MMAQIKMGLYITSDDWIWFNKSVLGQIRDDLFIKKYPCFKNALNLSKRLDFNIHIYSSEIMREMAFELEFLNTTQ